MTTRLTPRGFFVGIVCLAGAIALAAKSLPTAYFRPSVLYFRTGAASTESTTLTNTSAEALFISGLALIGPNSSGVSVTNTCGVSLAGGGSCTYSLTASPTRPGRIAELVEYDNSAAGHHSVLLEAK
jgi:hypothetical protein